MARFLLIHGSCHGAWCWRDVLPLLHAEGHSARAIDLPAHGQDTTPPEQATLERYAEAILAAIDEPVTVVGHSMAGYPISAAAERAPDKIAQLVYVCAYAPRSGESLAEMRRAGPSQPLAGAILTDPGRVTFRFDPARVPAQFYHDCPAETVAYALPRLCPEPIAPQETPLTLTARYASVPRHYIRCTEDRVIPPEYQETMASGWPPGHVTTLPTAHSPFFAAPGALAARLIAIATGGAA